MSNLTVKGNASGTGTVILEAPNTNSNRTITLPDATATLASVGNIITLGTAVASTSGTAIDFTGIPSWAKRVTILFNGVSLSGLDNILVQAIIGGSPATSGYSSVSGLAGANFNATSTAGFVIYAPNTAGVFYGAMRLQNISGNTWVEDHSGGIMVSTNVGAVGGGFLAAAGVLTGVRITVGNLNTFDAGTINIMWEG